MNIIISWSVWLVSWYRHWFYFIITTQRTSIGND